MTRFKDQVAAITGGADGLGKAIAKRLAEEGATLHLLDLDKTKLDETVAEFNDAGFDAFGHITNIAEEESVQSVFQAIKDESGTLDVMVNSAGIVGPSNKDITQTSVEDFDKVYSVNLRGSFLTAKSALEIMKEKDYGRILLIASIAGKEGNAGMCCYSSAKSGVIGLVKSIGKEYAETGITVNGLAPAVIRTAMVDGMPDEQVKYMTDKIPMKRCGTLDEVAAIVAFIVSPEAGFNTAAIFDISGGRATY